MKFEVCQVLAIGFLVLLYFDAVQAITCLYCQDLNSKNICKSDDQTCKGGKWTYCFTRRVIVDYKIVRMHRGCTRRCINSETRRRVVHMECCNRDYCNWKADLWNVHFI